MRIFKKKTFLGILAICCTLNAPWLHARTYTTAGAASSLSSSADACEHGSASSSSTDVGVAGTQHETGGGKFSICDSGTRGDTGVGLARLTWLGERGSSVHSCDAGSTMHDCSCGASGMALCTHQFDGVSAAQRWRPYLAVWTGWARGHAGARAGGKSVRRFLGRARHERTARRENRRRA